MQTRQKRKPLSEHLHQNRNPLKKVVIEITNEKRDHKTVSKGKLTALESNTLNLKQAKSSKVVKSKENLHDDTNDRNLEKDNDKTDAETNFYAHCRKLFRRSFLPDKIIGREEESKTIKLFLTKILNRESTLLYISGNPGSGKTALVQHLLNQVEGEFKKKKCIIKFINCMSIKDSRSTFQRLVKESTGDSVTVQDSFEKFCQIIKKSKEHLVFVLDELDSLVTFDCSTLYKLFELVLLKAGNLSIIGIANALDLTDRLMPRLKTKGFEIDLLNFVPYSTVEIIKILSERFPKEISIHENALELCARKVASIGDIRKAFDFINQAIDLIEKEKKTVISISHILKVIQHSVKPSTSSFKLDNLNLNSSLALYSYHLLTQSTKSEISIDSIYKRYSQLCEEFQHLVRIGQSEFNDVIMNLETIGIISLAAPKRTSLSTYKRVTCSILPDELQEHFQKDKFISPLIKQS